MAGRIDLNLPPRLIESARAAQYTNREVLGARALEQRIKAKARRRQEAAIRANPRLITPQQREGGQLEFQQAPLQRIWRRPRRREGAVDVGVSWYYQSSAVEPVSSNRESSLGWSNGEVVQAVVVGAGSGLFFLEGENFVGRASTRTESSSSTASSKLNLVLKVGSGSGEVWKEARHALSFSYSQSRTSVDVYEILPYGLGTLGATLTFSDTQVNTSSNFYYSFFSALYPVGDGKLLSIYAITQFAKTYSYRLNPVTYPFGAGTPFTVTGNTATSMGTTHFAFLASGSSVESVQVPLPASMQAMIEEHRLNLLQAQGIPFPNAPSVAGSGNTFSGLGIWNGLVGETKHVVVPFTGISSATFQNSIPFVDLESKLQQLNAEYTAVTGNSSIPILGYKRDSVGASTPTTERGTFGIIVGAALPGPTPQMLLNPLEDEVMYSLGPNAVIPETASMRVVYDYHGGTYCRDQLAALGVTLP